MTVTTTELETSTSSLPATTGTEADATAAPFNAYVSAMAAFDRSLTAPPNPDEPSLADTMIEPMLTTTRNLAAKLKGFGQASRYPDNSVHRITLLDGTVQGDVATLNACDVDDGVLYETATGRVLNDAVTTAHDRVTLRLDNGTWRLATRDQIEKWTGVAGCALGHS